MSTLLSNGLDPAKEELWYSWWTRARWTGTAAVDWEWELQAKQLLLSEARTRAAGGGEVKTGEEEL